ncbi:MAG TPA: glycosyltransferase family 1 protein [Bryobacteraceae bacterium]|nr:glycosyltransferase family 1 protein [Bryobacteraceae bacterium]
MRVAIDATPLSLSSGGLARYTQELSCALATTFPEDTYLLVSDQPLRSPPGAPENLHCLGGPQNRWERRWWLWGLERTLERNRAELFHGTHFEAPLLPRRPAVVTVHDLSPWMDASWQPGARRVRRRAPLVLGLRLAVMFITPTEAIRKQVMERFRIPAAGVVAVPLAAAPCFRPVSDARAEKRYFLLVATLEPRKNIETALAAWRLLRQRFGVEMLLAGRRRDDQPAPPAEPGLQWLGEVSDQELAGLYSGAAALLYPSLYEGFGLPVLEAMQCGTPVIASRIPAISEVAQEAAVLVDPRDVRAWAEAMEAVLTRPEWAAELRDRGLARAAEFSWRRTARLTREVYQEAHRRFYG